MRRPARGGQRAAKTAETARAKRATMQRRVRGALIVGVTVVIVAVLAFTVFPTQSYINQRNETKRAQHQLDVLSEQTAALRQKAKKLNSDAEIERLAREQYGMVKPGEESYVILPPPLPPVDYPNFWLLGDPDAAKQRATAPPPAPTDAN